VFFVFSGTPFEHQHEDLQSRKILDQLKEIYKTTSGEYCYCLLNVPFDRSDGSRRGQFDLIVCTSHTISIIELKSKSGRLEGEISRNYGNATLRLTYPDETKNEEIRLAQVEDQHRYLIELLDRQIREATRRKHARFRVDTYLIFNDPLDTSALLIKNEKIEKWLKINTIGGFTSVWQSTNHDQPFSLSEGDICYLAERCFNLHEVDAEDYSFDLRSLQTRIQSLLRFPSEQTYSNLDVDLLKREFLSRISKQEFDRLLELRARILELSDTEADEFRTLIETASVPNFPDYRFGQVHLSGLLGELKQSIEAVASSFLTIQEVCSQGKLLLNSYRPEVKSTIRATSTLLTVAAEKIKNRLWAYAESCEMKKWVSSTDNKRYQKTLEMLEILISSDKTESPETDN